MKQKAKNHIKSEIGMKNLRPLLAIFTVIALMLAGCSNAPTKLPPSSAKNDSVPAFILHKEEISKQISFPGELLPIERAEIFAKVSGYVSSVKVDIGDKIQKGEILVILDAPEVVANFAQVNSEMQVANSRYVGSLDAYSRIMNAAKVEGTVATGEMERIKSQMMADSSALEAAKAKLTVYAQLKDYLIVRAPFSGVVTQRNIDAGTLVGSNNTKPMLIIENNSILRLRLPVPEAYTFANESTLPVRFTVDAYPGIQFQAKLSRKAGALNLTNRTELWEFLYTNTDGRIKPGMFANASIKFSRSIPSFIVPSTAIVTNQERRFVIRVKNGQTQWVDVRTGITIDNGVEIFADLVDGDTLLVRGSDEIKPETKLKTILQ